MYRFLNQEGDVIYIGKAKDLKNRLHSHRHLPKACYEERVTIEYVEFETEDDMDLAERYYVPKYKPKYNYIYAERDLRVSLRELDKRQWGLYESTDFLRKYNETIESLTEKIERLKVKVEILNEEEGWFLKNEDGLVDASIYFKDPVKKEMINQIRLRKEEVIAELFQKKEQRFELITGKTKEDYNEREFQIMIENETYSQEETFDLLYIKARGVLYEDVKESVLTCCEYSLTKVFEKAAGIFTYNLLDETTHWLKWRGGDALLTNTVRSELAYQVIREVESQLEGQFGAFKEVLRRVDEQLGENASDDFIVPQAEVFKVLSDN